MLFLFLFQIKMVKYIIFIIHMLFLICWYEHGNGAATLVHLHCWYLQSIHKTDIMTSMTRTSARMTETRIRRQVVIVPSTSTVPGGTGTALTPIPMGGISHPAQMMAGPWFMLPFVITARVYAQWNSCSDKYVQSIIIIFT